LLFLSFCGSIVSFGQNLQQMVIGNNTNYTIANNGSSGTQLFTNPSLNRMVIQMVVHESMLVNWSGKNLDGMFFVNLLDNTRPLQDMTINDLSISIAEFSWWESNEQQINLEALTISNFTLGQSKYHKRLDTLQSNRQIVRSYGPLTIEANSFPAKGQGPYITFDHPYQYNGGHIVIQIEHGVVVAGSLSLAYIGLNASVGSRNVFFGNYGAWGRQSNLVGLSQPNFKLVPLFYIGADGILVTRFPMFGFVSCNDIPTFDHIYPVCQGADIELPITSLNGYEGTWTPEFDPLQTKTYTFKPKIGQCAKTAEKTIEVLLSKGQPQFSPIPPICQGDNFSLPVVSNNGIIGSWSPAVNNQQTTLYTFTPVANECATSATMTVEVIPKQMPIFTPISYICAGDELALPSTSDNNISGVWYPAPDNQNTTTYSFIPNVNECVYFFPATMTVSVKSIDTPTFNLKMIICQGEDNVDNLPTSSIEGVSGAWLPETVNRWETTTYTFTPNADECATSTQQTIVVHPNTLSTPAGESLQEFTIGQRISDLKVFGSNLIWYSNAMFSQTIGENEVFTDGATYYVVSDDGVCRSGDLAITVIRKDDAILSIDNINPHNLTFFPNPVNNILHLKSDYPIDDIVVRNVVGEIITVTINNDNTVIYFLDVPPSVYFVTGIINGVQQTFRIVKQ